VTALSNDEVSGTAVATAAAVGLGAAGAGGNATSTDNSTLDASVGSGATIQTNGYGSNTVSTYGALNITATSQGTVSAEVDGGSAAFGSIGAFLANATRGGSATASLDGSAHLTVGNLTVSASGAHTVTTTGTTVTVGILTGDGTTTTSKIQDTVQALVGTPPGTTPPSPLPTWKLHGNLQITASTTVPDPNSQTTTSNSVKATANGGVGGVLGVGVFTANATMAPQVTASLRGVNVTLPGSLIVTGAATGATGASATAGSGGLVAGDGAQGNTTDNTTVNTTLDGGTFQAAGVIVGASNSSSYAPKADSVNASALGASGALANHQGNTSATVTLGDGTTITSTGPVGLTATEVVTEDTQGDNAAEGRFFRKPSPGQLTAITPKVFITATAIMVLQQTGAIGIITILFPQP
jgi:hypothetical protein